VYQRGRIAGVGGGVTLGLAQEGAGQRLVLVGLCQDDLQEKARAQPQLAATHASTQTQLTAFHMPQDDPAMQVRPAKTTVQAGAMRAAPGFAMMAAAGTAARLCYDG